MDIPSDLIFNSEATLKKKLADFAAAGAENLHFVFDFDRTLTVPHLHTNADITSWNILHEHLPATVHQQFHDLYNLYRPKEIAGTMTEQDAITWWSTVLDSFVKYKLDMNEVEKDFFQRATIRPGVKELFDQCKQLGIPTVILSAGVKDVIDIWCRAYDVEPILVLSTDLELDASRKVIGWEKDTLVHVFNKDEADHEELTAIRAARPYAIVVGDGMLDANMADGDETVLRIRILDPRPDEILDLDMERAKTLELFDMLLESGNFNAIRDLLDNFANAPHS